MCCVVLRCFAAMAFACLAATPVRAREPNFPALTYSPWIKICLNNTCFIGMDGRANADCGPVVSAVLIERSGGTKKTLRVTLPTRVNLERGVSIIIDRGQVIERPYTDCFANGCMADYEAGAQLIDQLKQGRTLALEAVDRANSPISLTIPLIDFGAAYDGPAQEPKVFEEVVSTEEMQARFDREKRAEDERKGRCEAP